MWLKNKRLKPMVAATAMAFSAGGHAQEPATEPAEKQLPETHVRAEKLTPDLGQSSYGPAAIAATLGGNGDIGSLLTRHGSVQFDDGQLSADSVGDIAPANISIHGAKFYDNQFLLDGASMTSGISGGVKGPGTITDTPDADQSQGLAVDTRMLCKLTVLDANVGAEYGRFIGGVVDAQVCAPRKKFGGSVSLEHSASKWLEKKNRDNTASADVSKQDAFEKWTLRSNFEAQVSDSVGLVGAFSRKTSAIPLRAYSKDFSSPSDAFQKDVTHQIDNYYLKGFFHLGSGVKADASLAYMPSVSNMFVADQKDSGYRNQSGGLSASWGLSHVWGEAVFQHRWSYRSLQSSKFSDEQDKKFWFKSADKNWGKNSATEGGTGDVQQKENALGYKLDVDVLERKMGAATNRLKVGAEYEHNNFSYDRLTQHYNYLTSNNKTTIPGVPLNASTSTCNMAGGGVDTQGCSLTGSTGQYLNLRNKYRVGGFDYRVDYFALYAQDAISWDRWTVNLGLRAERFSDAEKITLAPRFHTTYQLEHAGLISFGVNRYYGQTLKMYRIYDKKTALNSGYEYRTLRNGSLTPWSTVADGAIPGSFDPLRTPYADELALGYAQAFDNTLWKFKYVHRMGKDEIGRTGGALQWGNVGKSRASTYTMEMETIEPMVFKSSETSFAAVLDYSTRTSNISDWNESNFSGASDNELQVWFQGNLIDKSQLPADNYRRPWTLRLMSSTYFKPVGVRMDGMLRVRGAYQKQMEAGTVSGYKLWKEVSMPKAVNFDLRLSKVWALASGNSVTAELTLENVFNRSNANGYDTVGYLFEKGRQASVRVGYEF